jgi:two-component system sensor histidine kinase/response regulator
VQVRTAELERANQAKSVFLANMSHELRTPLNAVLGFAQLLRRSPGLAGEDRRSLDIIRRAGEHLLGLINDVLSISKIEAGRLTLDAHPFSLRAMIQGIESMMRVRADKAGLILRIELAEGLPEAVQGDEGKLRQVLVNLLGNAVKFTKSGSVTLRAAWSDGRATFEVEDTGPGIAQAEQAALFEAFTQTESGRSSKEGTGLGLAITRQIIRLMGGEIRVRSEVGKGSTFSFDVLLPASSSKVVAIESRQVVGLVPGQRVPRVLVADDTEENRLLLVQLLGAIGIPVRESSNGLEAVELWEREKPDLILMDMRMPVLDGREATRRIRARENGGPKTSIVALTASAFEHERSEILACGADDFLAKPFREEDLFRVISAQTGVQFTTAAESPTAQTTVTKDLLVRLSPEEASRLREVLETGDVEKAAEVATRIRLRDEELGRTLLGEIRGYRVDHLLDLLENGATNG